MLKIGDKVFRNLQEQVGYNTEQIEEIFKTLDGINVQDNVVVVDDIAHIMTDEELEIVRKAVAFIVYNGHLYIKRSEDSSKAYFEVTPLVSVSSGVISFECKTLEVTLSNGALNSGTTTPSAYDKAENDIKLNAKANLNGANFTGPITAPSIVQNMSGYSFEKATKANITVEHLYAGVVQNGNKITFCIYAKITRTGTVDDNNFSLGRFTIPYEIGMKLYPALNNWLEFKKLYCGSGYNSGADINALVIKTSNILLDFIIYDPNNKLTANTDYYCRFENTFLLSDNLAS